TSQARPRFGAINQVTGFAPGHPLGPGIDLALDEAPPFLGELPEQRRRGEARVLRPAEQMCARNQHVHVFPEVERAGRSAARKSHCEFKTISEIRESSVAPGRGI